MSSTRVTEILCLMYELEVELGQEFQARPERTPLDPDTRQAHRKHRQSIARFLREGSVGSLLTAPVVYSLVIPFAILDFWVTVYQHVCFRVYGVPRVERGRFIVLDRHRLEYLNGIEKAHCAYCGYATGVIAYVREVAARTEQYWCPIRHESPVDTPHHRYHLFPEFGDAEGYHGGLPALREALQTDDGRGSTYRVGTSPESPRSLRDE